MQGAIDPFRLEELFYQNAHVSRISRLLAHYEIMKLTQTIPGAIVECGVFRGVSLIRFAALRELLGSRYARQIVGFDVFGPFPSGKDDLENGYVEEFKESYGSESISEKELIGILKDKNLYENLALVPGDIAVTVPKFIEENPHFRISILNIDVDLYEPTAVILDSFYPIQSPGGVVLFDDYGTFPGETEAVEAFFAGRDFKPKKFSFGKNPTTWSRSRPW